MVRRGDRAAGPVVSPLAVEFPHVMARTPVGGGPMKILVAEDDDLSAFVLRHQLERQGHEVTVASDGSEAWRLAQDSWFPVVISDWMMPGLEGPELCRKIRGRGGQPYTYVILLTSKNSRQDRLAGLEAGADDFLVKPPDSEELAVRLEIARRILAVQEDLQRRNAHLSELALSDELTGVGNRRRFREALALHHSLAVVRGMLVSLVVLDVDRFKVYNDDFGHPAGDDALRRVARALVEGVRKHDEVARIGGEEFAVILPDVDAAGSIETAERIRSVLARVPWPLRPLTASLGIATTSSSTPTASDLVDQADRALYRCKRAGRDRVGHFSESSDDPPVIGRS
jgi:diguanylate cyclase (GGDEF)-like protein